MYFYYHSSFSVIAFFYLASFIYAWTFRAKAPFLFLSFSFIKLCLVVWYLSLLLSHWGTVFFDHLLIIPFLDSYVFRLGTHNLFSLSLSCWDSYVFCLGSEQVMGPSFWAKPFPSFHHAFDCTTAIHALLISPTPHTHRSHPHRSSSWYSPFATTFLFVRYLSLSYTHSSCSHSFGVYPFSHHTISFVLIAFVLAMECTHHGVIHLFLLRSVLTMESFTLVIHILATESFVWVLPIFVIIHTHRAHLCHLAMAFIFIIHSCHPHLCHIVWTFVSLPASMDFPCLPLWTLHTTIVSFSSHFLNTRTFHPPLPTLIFTFFVIFICHPC